MMPLSNSVCLALCLATLYAMAAGDANNSPSAPLRDSHRPQDPLQIRALIVDGRSMPIQSSGKLHLPVGARSITFGFGVATNAAREILRLRYKLDGFEEEWRQVVSDQSLSVRFIDTNQEPVDERVFRPIGESPGWTGSLDTSAFVHGRATLAVPPGAVGLWVAVSSAGPPNAVGVYAISNLVVSRPSAAGSPAAALIRWDSHSPGEASGAEWLPTDWVRNGLRIGMARITGFGISNHWKALTILDNDPGAHAEWTTRKEAAVRVVPGEELLLEWDEAYSIALSGPMEVTYSDLPPGFYRFRLNELSLLGMPGGAEASLAFEIPPSFWRTRWAWVLLAMLGLSAAAGAYRYIVWFQMRGRLASLESQRLLEHERVRIARDIHDDLGARVTQISLVSGLAQSDTSLPEKARTEFGVITGMATELVSSLYETVWAVNPENDNLDALGNYICQMVDNLCDKAQMPRRLRVSNLPSEVQVSSHVRHNLVLAAKEAVHNVIKHANASELSVQVDWAGDTLTIRVRDNGRGFDPATRPAGNGLGNMRRRLEQVGGECVLASSEGQGTTVTFTARIQPAG